MCFGSGVRPKFGQQGWGWDLVAISGVDNATAGQAQAPGPGRSSNGGIVVSQCHGEPGEPWILDPTLATGNTGDSEYVDLSVLPPGSARPSQLLL